MPQTFTAIDFETAQGKRWSICQIGLVRIENGIVVNKINKLVYPPDNYYHFMNTRVHGLTSKHTRTAPTFDLVWPEIKKFIHKQTVVAHNGAFDFNCLAQTLDYYGMAHPKFKQQCTYKIYGQDLATLCKQHKIELKHHDALSDAMACAKLYQMHLALQKTI